MRPYSSTDIDTAWKNLLYSINERDLTVKIHGE